MRIHSFIHSKINVIGTLKKVIIGVVSSRILSRLRHVVIKIPRPREDPFIPHPFPMRHLANTGRFDNPVIPTKNTYVPSWPHRLIEYVTFVVRLTQLSIPNT